MARADRKRRPQARPAASRSGNPAVRAHPPSVAPPRHLRPASRSSTVAALPPEVAEIIPVEGAQYPQILRNEHYQWWRSLAGATFGVAAFLLMSTVVTQIIIAIAWLLTGHGTPYAAYYASSVRFERAGGMLGANLGIATLIPISWGLMAVMHRVRPRWLSSVQPRIRWRYLLICLAVAAVVLNGVLFLSTVISGLPPYGMQRGFLGFLVVVVLTSPIQAAAEEIFFRGYLMQALGSFFARPWFGVVVSSVVFALFHGTQNWPLFVDRLAFGLLAALLVWRTGGLEAGIAAHVANNLFAYIFAGLTTSIATIRAVKTITWTDAAFDVGGFALFAVLAFVLARVMGLRTTVSRASVGD